MLLRLALLGFLRIQTPSIGVNSAATHHDAMSAMATTAKIEKGVFAGGAPREADRDEGGNL